MEPLLQQLPNGGAVIAIIAVVVLFLKVQERGEDRRETKLQEITTRFADEIQAAREDYLESLRELTKRPDGSSKRNIP